MRHRLKRILNKAKSLSLSLDEKEGIKATLLAHMKSNPLSAESGSFEISKRVSYISWVGHYFNHKNIMVPSALLLFLVLTTGISFAAHSSLPGGLLYPVKIINEKISSTFAIDPLDKARTGAIIAMNRLKEAETLFVDGRLDEKTEITLADSFEKDSDSANDSFVAAQKDDKELGTEEALRFKNELDKHQRILKSFADFKDGGIKSQILAEKVDNVIVKLDTSIGFIKPKAEQSVTQEKPESKWMHNNLNAVGASKSETALLNATATTSATTTAKATTTEGLNVAVEGSGSTTIVSAHETAGSSLQNNTQNAGSSEHSTTSSEATMIKTPSVHIETHASESVTLPSISL